MAKAESDHPDDWGAGLWFSGKTLNTTSVASAKLPGQVLKVCLQHNLRQDNERHRHRYPPDAARTPLNQVLRGPSTVEVAVQLANDNLESLGITPPRRDTIMGIELVFQSPTGGDTPAFWAACLQWVDSRYGAILSAVVHRDQKRPHMHVIVQPIAGGKLAGAALTQGANRIVRQRAEFFAFIRQVLGLPPDRRHLNPLTDLALSSGRGPKSRAEAKRRDAKLERDAAARQRREQQCRSAAGQAHEPAKVAAQTRSGQAQATGPAKPPEPAMSILRSPLAASNVVFCPAFSASATTLGADASADRGQTKAAGAARQISSATSPMAHGTTRPGMLAGTGDQWLGAALDEARQWRSGTSQAGQPMAYGAPMSPGLLLHATILPVSWGALDRLTPKGPVLKSMLMASARAPCSRQAMPLRPRNRQGAV